MSHETAELGPILNSIVADFHLLDHKKVEHSLPDLMGKTGLLLGFIGDIWQPASVRRILWLQRHVQKFAQEGTATALLVRDYPHTLYGFHSSSPLPVPFPLLADPAGDIHRLYRMDLHPGLLLIDSIGILREKWLVPDDRVWPKLHELMESIQSLHALA
ncbi:MAG: hypothetical protein OHK0046_14500 [Anaerolineae bacterium]